MKVLRAKLGIFCFLSRSETQQAKVTFCPCDGPGTSSASQHKADFAISTQYRKVNSRRYLSWGLGAWAPGSLAMLSQG